MTDSSMKIELRIDWSELDAFGHVNNLEIMKYIQAARLNYLEKVGLMKLHDDENKGPILASIHCQFRKPLFYPGQVVVLSKVEYIKNTSFKVQHEIFNESNELVAEAQDIIVFYDFTKKHKIAITTQIKQKIESMENSHSDLEYKSSL